MNEEKLNILRERMVESQIIKRGVSDQSVLAAMRKVKRHLFVEGSLIDEAYEDYPLPIGDGQTISQPYIVALMTELMALKGGERVLEIGTGSGYQAAVLAEIAKEVYTIEIVEGLAERAKGTLKGLGYANIFVKAGDGYRGWPDKAPFDAIMITAAPPRIPEPLVDQLKIDGVIVLPLGVEFQELIVAKKTKHGIEKRYVIPVRFVPMTGEIEKTGK